MAQPPNAQSSKVTTVKLQAGDVLLKPGDKLNCVYVIQSGRLSLQQSRSGKLIEISQLRAPELIGEDALYGVAQWQLTALAIRETVVIRVPFDVLQGALTRSTAGYNAIVRSIFDRVKAVFTDLKAVQANREVVPCPPDNTAKVFGVIFHSARSVGAQEDGATVAGWEELKRYAFEVFDESIVRLEDAVNILIRLGYAKLEGSKIHLSDMAQIEAFFDFYGNYHFKGGYGDYLKTNPRMQKITESFLQVASAYPVDRAGYAHLPYKAAIDAMKKVMGSSFEADQLFRLEQKGLFIKRVTTQDGGVLSFYKPDFDQMLLNWKILKELEGWNEKGFVDMTGFTPGPKASDDPESERKRWAQLLADWKPVAPSRGVPTLRSGLPKPGEIWCMVCLTEVAKNQKACHVCGGLLGNAAA